MAIQIAVDGEEEEAMSSQGDPVSSRSGSRFRGEYEELCGKVREEFVNKLQIDGADDGVKLRELEGEPSEHNSRYSLESAVSDQEHEEEDEEEFEFSFAGANPDGSLISAEDVFQNGQIRPMYPLFGRSLLFSDSQDEAPESTAEASYPRPPLKKVFVEMPEPNKLDGGAEGTYCVWNSKTVEEAAPPEACSKSNSTGFSRLWRFKDLVRRSNSDGKDAFVFLNAHRSRVGGGKARRAKKDGEVSREKVGKTAATKKAKRPVATAEGQAAGEKHSVCNRRKSYLPYRQNLVGLGFFTNVSGMTKNVHPF